MLELHYWPTPNGWTISILLEECGLPYRMVPVNIGRGEQYTPEFVALINQHHKMPAVVDHAPVHGRGPLSISETGAILLYIAEKTGRFLPAAGAERAATLQWLMWAIGSLGPMVSQNSHFLQYASEDVPYAIGRYGREVRRLYGVLERQLASAGPHVSGAAFSIADIATLPWIRMHKAQHLELASYPEIRRWYDMVLARPGVQRGLALGRELRAPVLSDEARRALFGSGAGAHGLARQRWAP